MGQPNEPSMEEILSSIKRIIAEDVEPVAPKRAEPAPADDPDVLELTQPVGGDPEPEPAFEAEEEPMAAEEAPALAEAPAAPRARPAPAPAAGDAALLSETSEAATRNALAALSRMVVKPEDPTADNTLEGLVREMLRPMLKEWLDANLPRIVQSTVEREVARIAGRGA
jgi:cell pole-organizing protein PopZ